MSQFPHDEFVKEYLPELIQDYFLSPALNTGIVIIHQLPVNKETFFCLNYLLPIANCSVAVDIAGG